MPINLVTIFRSLTEARCPAFSLQNFSALTQVFDSSCHKKTVAVTLFPACLTWGITHFGVFIFCNISLDEEGNGPKMRKCKMPHFCLVLLSFCQTAMNLREAAMIHSTLNHAEESVLIVNNVNITMTRCHRINTESGSESSTRKKTCLVYLCDRYHLFMTPGVRNLDQDC